MTSLRDFEGRLGEILHDEATAAAQTTDTTRELARLRLRVHRAGAQRFRRVAAAVAAVVVVLALAWGLGPQRDDATPAGSPVIDLDNVLARYQPLAASDVSRADALPVVSGLGRVTGIAQLGNRLVTFSPAPGNRIWTMAMVTAGRPGVGWRLRFVAQGDVRLGAADGVGVIVVSGGGPLPAAGAAGAGRDGLLRFELATGKVLGFTPLPLASDVAGGTDGTVWVATPHRVLHVRARTGQRLGSIRTPGIIRDLRVAGGTLWLSDDQATPARVYAVDAKSGKLRRTYTLAAASTVVRAPGATLVIALRTGRVVRIPDDGGPIRAAQLAVSETFMVRQVAAVGSDVWLSIGDRVLRVDGRTLAFEGGIDPAWDGPPYASAHLGSRLLVADPSAGLLRSVPDAAFRRP